LLHRKYTRPNPVCQGVQAFFLDFFHFFVRWLKPTAMKALIFNIHCRQFQLTDNNKNSDSVKKQNQKLIKNAKKQAQKLAKSVKKTNQK